MPLLRRFAPYGAAILVCAFALLLRRLFGPLLDEQAWFLVLIAAITFSTWYGGARPGMLATGLCVLATWFLPLFTALMPPPSASLLALGIFVLAGLFINALSGGLHSIRLRAALPLRATQVDHDAHRYPDQRYRHLFESAPLMYVITSNQAGVPLIAACNELFLRTLGYTRAEVIQRPLSDFYTAESRRALLEGGYQQALTNDCIAQERALVARDGRIIDTLLRALPEVDSDGVLCGMRAMYIDITERKRDAEALQRAAARLQILHQIDQAMLTAHASDTFATAALQQLGQLLAFDQADLLVFDHAANVAHVLATHGVASARAVGDRILLDDFKDVCGGIWDAGRSAADILAHAFTAVLPAPLQAAGMQSHLCAPLIAQQRIIGMLFLQAMRPGAFNSEDLDIVHEVGSQLALSIRQTQLFEQVYAGRARLQALSRRLVEVQEAERRQIARELHDEIGQELTGLKFLLEMAEHSAHMGQEVKLHEAHMLVANLMTRVRELSLNLRPTMLDDLGLLPALIWHFERYTAQTGIQIDFHHQRIERRFPPAIETAAYRIIQEALTNIARYADVRAATITVRLDDGVLRLEVVDCGHGFDPQTVLHARTSNGLTSMRERAVLVGGALTIESTPGLGTRLMTVLPIDTHIERRRQERS